MVKLKKPVNLRKRDRNTTIHKTVNLRKTKVNLRKGV